MNILRRFLGVFVMIAGIIGLLLSLAGLVGIWMAKPVITSSLDTIIATLSSTVDTSKDTLAITYDALGATIDSVDGLSEMLVTTAATVEDTQPVLTEVNLLMGVTLPETLQAAAGLAADRRASRQITGERHRIVRNFPGYHRGDADSQCVCARHPNNLQP